MRRRLLALLLAAAVAGGCDRADPTAERRGDALYAEGRYAPALGAYRSALGGDRDPRLLGKIAHAALRAGERAEAADAFLALAAEDLGRLVEATDGLVQVGRAAREADDPATLRIVMDGLRALAPDWPVGRWALSIVQRQGADAGLELLPAALGAALDAGAADSVLLGYGRALAAAGDCGRAVGALDALGRRRRAALSPEAAAVRAGCALRLGRDALAAGDTAEAIGWLEDAAEPDAAAGSAAEGPAAEAARLLESLTVPDAAGDTARMSLP